MKKQIIKLITAGILILANLIGHTQTMKNEENLDKYEQLFREKILEKITSNGYSKGYNFDSAGIEVSKSNHYVVPRITGSLSYNGTIIYVPQGLAFDHLVEISMILLPEGIEFKERDRGATLHYWSQDYPDLPYQKNTSLVKKGPYPGIEYFKEEIDAIAQSLKKHQPSIDVHSFTQQSFNLGDPINGVMQRAPNFYQVSDDVVYMEFVYDAESQIDFGFKIHYNIKTGEIIHLRRMSPPMLM